MRGGTDARNRSDCNVQACADFDRLTADVMIDAVEEALGRRMSGLANPLNSYINRVYELAAADGERFIAKFYRPGRWSQQAVQDEHDYVLACAEAEIPVVAPLVLESGATLEEAEGILFAVYRKKRGRELEALTDEDWRRLGRVVSRLHVVGSQEDAHDRIRLRPDFSTRQDVADLAEAGVITPMHRGQFADVTGEILELIPPLFEGMDAIRIHGDCHCGNLLERPGEGILVIDFDDMATGPPVQDLWMLPPTTRMPHVGRST